MHSLILILISCFILQAVESKYAVTEIPEKLQELIAESLLETDNDLNAVEKLANIKHVLKRILSADGLETLESSVDANGDIALNDSEAKKPCNMYFSCNDCVSQGCGWCIAQRACREDAAWMCLGDHDHVGLSGIGKHLQCPPVEVMKEQRAQRRKRKKDAADEQVAKLLQSNIAASENKNSTDQSFDDGDASSGDASSGSVQLSKEEKSREISRRAELAKSNYGVSNPYETLSVDSTASNGEIRKAYRKLSLLYHPDKNPSDPQLAEAAFKDIVAAFDILGNPEKRAYFDDVGSSTQESFNNFDDYMRFGQKNENNFYQGYRLITPLSESMWERRVGSGDNIWLVEFYAPW